MGDRANESESRPHIAPNPGLHYTGRQPTAVRSHTMSDSTNANAPLRPIERWLGNYSGDHLNRSNQRIHLVCVPAIVWTLIAALWAIPVPPALGQPGLWAGIALALALSYYWRLSRPLALGLLVAFVLMGLLSHVLYQRLGGGGLAIVAGIVFVIAWIGQFIGHHIEGKRPSFFTDLVYLLIGPLWTLSKLYRRLGWAY